MNLSELIGKEVVFYKEALKIGSVYDVIFDNKLKRLTHIMLMPNENIEDVLLLVPLKNIIKKESEIVFINSLTCFVFYKEEYFKNTIRSPLGQFCYNEKGELKGILKDIVLDENFKPIEIIINNTYFLKENIIYISKNCTLIKESNLSRYNAEKE